MTRYDFWYGWLNGGAMREAAEGEFVKWAEVQTLLAEIEQRHGIVIEYRRNATPIALAPPLDISARAPRAPERGEPLTNGERGFLNRKIARAEHARQAAEARVAELEAWQDDARQSSVVKPASSERAARGKDSPVAG
jgi:hypothetical protein